jgi:hypothetical protein
MKIININKFLLKAVIKTHRLLGFFLCLLFLIWCLSGFVMMYKGFPSVSKSDKLEVQKILDGKKNKCSFKLNHLINKDSVKNITMQVVGGEEVLTIETHNDCIFNLEIDSSINKRTYSKVDAESIITTFYQNKINLKESRTIYALDQWIPRTSFLKHLPIHLIRLDDNKNTVCYVSSKTGELLQKLNQYDKAWTWVGAIPHWIYFKDIRINTPLWRFIVISLSMLGVVLSILGIVIGINRFIIARKRGLLLNPYKKKWFKWHHYLGFIFGTFTFTWILSGLFSMNPLKWSPEKNLSQIEQKIWDGNISFRKFQIDSIIHRYISEINQKDSVKSIEFKKFDSQWYAIENLNSTKRRLFTMKCKDFKLKVLQSNFFLPKIKELFPNDSVVEVEKLFSYDDYYYSRDKTLPLPVYKYIISDLDKTVLYVDPLGVEVLKKMGQRNRFERWIYNGLHSFDFEIIRNKRPLWDVVVIILLIGVTALSFSGVVLTFIKIRRNIK